MLTTVWFDAIESLKFEGMSGMHYIYIYIFVVLLIIITGRFRYGQYKAWPFWCRPSIYINGLTSQKFAFSS